MWHPTSSQMSEMSIYTWNIACNSLWSPVGDISVSGACWADFTCRMSHIMICNLSCQPCDRPFSLVSKKHSHMFKIGQFHSVVRPCWYMGPLGLRFMALWTLCALTRAQRLQLERKNGFVLWALSKVPGSPRPLETGPKCQPHHQERINRKNYSALYNCCLGHFQIDVQLFHVVTLEANIIRGRICFKISFLIITIICAFVILQAKKCPTFVVFGFLDVKIGGFSSLCMIAVCFDFGQCVR